MRRVLVAGELNADLVMSGLPSLPVLGQELLGDDFQVVLGSSSAITAARLARLGAPVDFVGLVGDDDMGRFVLKQLDQFGVGTDRVQVVAGAQTGVTISLTYPHDRAMLTVPGVMAAFDGATITAELLAGYAHLHVSSFPLQPALQPALPGLFRLAHACGLTTSLDSGWDPDERWLDNPHLPPTLAETDYFFPNEDEVRAMLGGAWEPVALGAKVGGTLLIKQGSRGALAVLPDSGQVAVEALPVTAVDTTGAGDAFNAGFLYATLIEGAAIREAMTFAAACGAQAVTQVGGATNAPDAATIAAMLAAQDADRDKAGDMPGD